MLRPSISRAEFGTLTEWIECVEVASLRLYGTLTREQQLWLDTFLTVPPGRFDIKYGDDTSVLRGAA